MHMGRRFSSRPDALMQVFGESVSFDKRLASYDLQGSLGHAAMLAHVGLISAEEFKEIEQRNSRVTGRDSQG